MKKRRIEIYDWMTAAYELSGLKLIVYALIYGEVEITAQEIADILNIDYSEALSIATQLKWDGLIETRRLSLEERDKHTFNEHQGGNYWVYYVVEDELF